MKLKRFQIAPQIRVSVESEQRPAERGDFYLNKHGDVALLSEETTSVKARKVWILKFELTPHPLEPTTAKEVKSNDN